ncbi:hypothetical protein J6590_085013 [Homalodisca vitripennis]|nr:hypothetical protein J6590_085013 [Homalodisca vitripennis]
MLPHLKNTPKVMYKFYGCIAAFTRGQLFIVRTGGQLTGSSNRLDVSTRTMEESASTSLTRVELNNIFRDLCRDFVSESSKVLQKELNKKREWTRKLILLRDSSGASSQLLSELRLENPIEYRALLRISPVIFDELLHRVSPLIAKQDTVMREVKVGSNIGIFSYGSKL